MAAPTKVTVTPTSYTVVSSTSATPADFCTEAIADTHDAFRLYISDLARVWPLLATIRQKNGSLLDLLRGCGSRRFATTSSVRIGLALVNHQLDHLRLGEIEPAGGLGDGDQIRADGPTVPQILVGVRASQQGQIRPAASARDVRRRRHCLVPLLSEGYREAVTLRQPRVPRPGQPRHTAKTGDRVAGHLRPAGERATRLIHDQHPGGPSGVARVEHPLPAWGVLVTFASSGRAALAGVSG